MENDTDQADAPDPEPAAPAPISVAPSNTGVVAGEPEDLDDEDEA